MPIKIQGRQGILPTEENKERIEEHREAIKEAVESGDYELSEPDLARSWLLEWLIEENGWTVEDLVGAIGVDDTIVMKSLWFHRIIEPDDRSRIPRDPPWQTVMTTPSAASSDTHRR